MNRNQPQQQTEEEQKNEESNEGNENKEKTELYVCLNKFILIFKVERILIVKNIKD